MTKHNFELSVLAKIPFTVQEFTVTDEISRLFSIFITATSTEEDIDFDAVVGKEARFVVHTGEGAARVWDGVVSQLEQIEVEETGLSTYLVEVVPFLWLSTHRRNYRIFQHLSEPEIALKMLAEWDSSPELKIDLGQYKKRKYKVQYAESDFAFLSRVLEDAGIAFYYDQGRLVLSDAPQRNEAREGVIPFYDAPSQKSLYATEVRVARAVRPGRYTMRDHDYRKAPDYDLKATATAGTEVERLLERYHYTPGAFLFRTDSSDPTPAADDRGATRTDEREAAAMAVRRLDAKRGGGKTVTFSTNALDLAPGDVVVLSGHPRPDIDEARLLVTGVEVSGGEASDAILECTAVSAALAFRPPLITPRPKAVGVESGTVVGPKGEEIHTDEFGRVRVHFHWNRESDFDDTSSCWIHVSQPWAGKGYGGVNLPRIGQEVLVDFLGGDPDRPVVVGRVYTNVQKVPYKLPAGKTQSGWKSNSTNGTGGFNEIKMEDQSGNELFSMQAERDYSHLTKRNSGTTVSSNRSTSVGRNDTHVILGAQSSVINEDRIVGANGPMTYTATGEIGEKTGNNAGFKAAVAFTAKSKSTRLEGEKMISRGREKHVFKVKGSSITMEPGKITIEAPIVEINVNGPADAAPPPPPPPAPDAEIAGQGAGGKNTWKRRPDAGGGAGGGRRDLDYTPPPAPERETETEPCDTEVKGPKPFEEPDGKVGADTPSPPVIPSQPSSKSPLPSPSKSPLPSPSSKLPSLPSLPSPKPDTTGLGGLLDLPGLPSIADIPGLPKNLPALPFSAAEIAEAAENVIEMGKSLGIELPDALPAGERAGWILIEVLRRAGIEVPAALEERYPKIPKRRS